MPDQTWNEFEQRCPAMSRSKTLRIMQDLHLPFSELLTWHDGIGGLPASYRPKPGTLGKEGKFRTDLVRTFLQSKHIGLDLFLVRYRPRRIQGTSRLDKSTATAPSSRNIADDVRRIISMNLSDKVTVQAIREIFEK
jgi:hypothetical protein